MSACSPVCRPELGGVALSAEVLSCSAAVSACSAAVAALMASRGRVRASTGPARRPGRRRAEPSRRRVRPVVSITSYAQARDHVGTLGAHFEDALAAQPARAVPSPLNGLAGRNGPRGRLALGDGVAVELEAAHRDLLRGRTSRCTPPSQTEPLSLSAVTVPDTQVHSPALPPENAGHHPKYQSGGQGRDPCSRERPCSPSRHLRHCYRDEAQGQPVHLRRGCHRDADRDSSSGSRGAPRRSSRHLRRRAAPSSTASRPASSSAFRVSRRPLEAGAGSARRAQAGRLRLGAALERDAGHRRDRLRHRGDRAQRRSSTPIPTPSWAPTRTSGSTPMTRWP